MQTRADLLVSTEWLAEHLSAPDLVVLDGSWYLPAMQRDARAEYDAGHIPGALFFDIDAIADTSSDLPHMLPKPHVFSSTMRKMGIGDGMTIVVYDGMGLFAAPRVWWTFRAMGVEDVFVLDGGLPKWKAEERPLDDEPAKRPERHFTARLDYGAVKDIDDMRRIVDKDGADIIDARSAGRFAGTEPEPRQGLRSGHIPGSLNLPFTRLVNNGMLVSDEAIRAAVDDIGLDPGRDVVTSCGSGVSASVVTFALAAIGRHSAVYDGSWAEWGGRDDTPIEPVA